MSSSSLPESGFPPRDSFEETQGADSRPQGPWASSQRGSDARAPVPPPPFPGRDSVEETQGGDSRLAGSWASSRTSADRQQVGPYTVLRELGRGSWGVVFLGSKPGEAPVAIKLLLEKGQADPEARARFEREAELAARIRHPGIVPLLRAGQEARGMYYAMEYVPGPTLKDHFAQRGRLLPEEACELVATLAEALEAAHLQGVVHRDVKPANVILEAKTGRPRLADFGLARDTLRGSNLTQTRDVIGTPAYMAPEQFSGARVDARADVYALGVILYQALLGRLPYKADNVVALQHQVLRGGYPSPLALRPDLPPALEPILARALARDPAQRFQSAGELADALSQDLERPEALYLPPLEQTAHKRPRWFMSLALGLLCGAPLHLLLREDVADPVLEAQPPLEAPPPAEQLREVFTLAGRGLPYTALAWRLDQLELYPTERTAAQVALAFRRGRLRKTMRLAEGLPHDDASPLVQEARLRAGLAATFLAEYRIATATLEPLTLTAEPYADVARAWMCLADDYTFSPQDYAEAVRLLDGVLERDSRHLLAQLARAYFAVAKTHLEGLPYVDRLEVLAPDHWVVPHLRGRGLRFDPTRAAEAAALLQRAAELTQSDCEPTLGYLVQALLISDQLPAAREALKRALSRYPRVGGLIALQAAVAELSGEPAAAEAALRKLMETVGPERANLEVYWLRTPPMGPALEQAIERLRAPR